jgi:hypothetical protein
MSRNYRLSNITRRARERLQTMPGRAGSSLLHDLEAIGKAIGKDADTLTAANFELIAGSHRRPRNRIVRGWPVASPRREQ